jgi:tetratricopeptide (TPR) repeat protein
MADSARIEELKRRVQLDPASIAFASLAEEYRRAGQFDAAIATCEAGLQRHPAYLSARVTLGRCLIETGRYDEARAALEQVLQAAPENLAAIRGLAEIHHRVGEDPETAQSYASSFADLEPAPAEAPPPAPPPPPAAPPPVTPIALSSVPADAPAAGPAADTAAAPAPRRPHPDEAALPALESFLAAIVMARMSARSRTH